MDLAQGLAIAIAGVLAPWVAEAVNRLGGWQDTKALWIAYVVALVIGALAAFATGLIKVDMALSNPPLFLQNLAAVLGLVYLIANAVFESWIKKTRKA